MNDGVCGSFWACKNGSPFPACCPAGQRYSVSKRTCELDPIRPCTDVCEYTESKSSLGPVSSKVVRRIFNVKSSHFPLPYIRFTKFVRQNLFNETGLWTFESSHVKRDIGVMQFVFLQMCMSSCPKGSCTWVFVWSFLEFSILSERTTMAVARPEPKLFAYAISIIFTWADLFRSLQIIMTVFPATITMANVIEYWLYRILRYFSFSVIS